MPEGEHSNKVQLKEVRAVASSLQANGVAQKQMASVSVVQQQENISETKNETGLPDQLKSGVESLSGISLDNVKVHYNSSAPAQLNAYAYAQGSDIHVGPGQEKHLPHEAWHVVQQAQGRVSATTQMKGYAVNDDTALEAEADVMGARALGAGLNIQQKKSYSLPVNNQKQLKAWPGVIQRAATVAQVGGGNQVVGYRNLVATEYQRAVIPFGQGFAIRERISVFGNPGFGRNVGNIVGNGNNETRPSVDGVSHTEPILIGRTYGAAAANPTWLQANAVVDAANAGAAARPNFAIYTERIPCGGCTPELANARYQAADTVSWSYPLATGTQDIAHSHIARAAAQFGYFFAVDAARAWRLAGFRIQILPAKKTEPQKPADDSKGGGSGGGSGGDGRGFDPGFAKGPASRGINPFAEGSAHNPIVVEDVQQPGVMISE